MEDAEAFAANFVEKMGPTEALLLAMRLVLIVGQKAPEDPKVVAAAKTAIESIKVIGAQTGVFTPVS
jgi:hypothetical protein